MISQILMVLTALLALVAPVTVAVRLTPGALATFSEDEGIKRHLMTEKMDSDEAVMDSTSMDDDKEMVGEEETMTVEDSEMETVVVSAVAPAPAGCSTIVDLAVATPDLSTLVAAVTAAPEVAAELSGVEEYTVFAPNNEAFAMLPQEPLMELLKQVEALTFILDLHIVPGTVLAADLMDGDVLETVNGFNLTVSVAGGNVTIMAPDGGEVATVVTADVLACNGVVHIIDAVLIPGNGDDDVSEGPTSVLDSMGGYGGESPMGAYDDVEVVDAFAAPVPTAVTATAALPAMEDDDDVVAVAPVAAVVPMEDDDVVEDDDEVVAVQPVTAVVPMEDDDDVEEETTTTRAVAPPVEVPVAEPTMTSTPQGKYGVCIAGSAETFGPTVEQREYEGQGSAVTITKKDDGSLSCSWEEYAGGFDGMPSRYIDDDHENGLDMAIKQMLPAGKAEQEAFLQAMLDMAKPEDLDFPQDKEKADGGVRMSNIGKLNSACSALLYNTC